jgi:hypothetical protein
MRAFSIVNGTLAISESRSIPKYDFIETRGFVRAFTSKVCPCPAKYDDLDRRILCTSIEDQDTRRMFHHVSCYEQ